MRTDQRTIAAFAATQITTAPSALSNGVRSPERVLNLLRGLERLSFEEAMKTLDTLDDRIADAIETISIHHTRYFRRIEGKKPSPVIDKGAAQSTWGTVLYKLREFADQEGGQRLLDAKETANFLASIRKNLESFTETAKV